MFFVPECQAWVLPCCRWRMLRGWLSSVGQGWRPWWPWGGCTCRWRGRPRGGSRWWRTGGRGGWTWGPCWGRQCRGSCPHSDHSPRHTGDIGTLSGGCRVSGSLPANKMSKSVSSIQFIIHKTQMTSAMSLTVFQSHSVGNKYRLKRNRKVS